MRKPTSELPLLAQRMRTVGNLLTGAGYGIAMSLSASFFGWHALWLLLALFLISFGKHLDNHPE